MSRDEKSGLVGPVTMFKQHLLFSLLVCLFCALLVSYLFLDMRSNSVLAVATTAFMTITHGQTQYISTNVSAVDAARATALTLSPVSSIKGKRFDRFVNIA
jgi:hypothetical protein